MDFVSPNLKLMRPSRTSSRGSDTTTLGGFYAQPSNIGKHTRDQFAWVPEVTVNAGFKVNDRITAMVGYNFLWINNVLRPGDQIDPVINPTQFPGGTLTGPARPAVPFNDSAFWAQGINFGVQIRY